MMRVSPFRLALGVTVLGIIWISLVFAEAEKTQDTILLRQSDSFGTELEFTGTGIGFYRIHMPEFSGEEIFVQIRDGKSNVIGEERVQTRMSVGYFDYNGTYAIKVTNLSENQISMQVEFGSTNSQRMVLPGILILVGVVTTVAISYFRLKNYKMAHPDENIS